MWELDNKKGWVLKNWCFQTVVLEKTLQSPLDSKIKPVTPKGNQPWIFIWRTHAEVPIFWPLDGKSWLIGKDPDAGKTEGRKRGDDRDSWMASLTQWTWVGKLRDMVKDREAYCVVVHGVAKRWTQLNNDKIRLVQKLISFLCCWTLLFNIGIHS